MSYFSNAYRKSFVGTKATQAGSGSATAVDDGFIMAAGIATSALSNTATPNTLGPGTYGFFDPSTYLSVLAASTLVTTGKPLILAGSSLYANDKIGPFHGGYKESNKSKMINPKYINKWARMQGAGAEQAIYHVGNTNLNSSTATGTLTLTTAGTGYTASTTATVLLTTVTGTGAGLFASVTTSAGGIVTAITIVSGGQGFVVGNTLTIPSNSVFGAGTGALFTIATIKYNVSGNTRCAFEFLCGETYNLQFNLYGAQVLRYLNHDLYKTLAAYTGCCPTGSLSPTPVDSTLVMINWANQVINDVWMKDFIQPIVYSQSGVPMFATTALAAASLNGIITVLTAGAFQSATTGTYTNIPLTGGSGTGATATVVVAAGTVTSITLANPGTGYTAANTLTIPAGVLGIGHTVAQTATVTTISTPATSVNVWTNYVSPGYIAGTVAGLRFIGAYVETTFGNCSFQKTDYFDQEIVQMIVQMMDIDGNPCNANLCSKSESAGFVGQGSGEVVFRDVILDESYLQNTFSSDSRIREITQGDQLFTAVPRNQRYTRYILNHSVPRYNNPTGIYDDDQYSLNIYVPTSPGVTAAAFETFVNAWLVGATSSVSLETFDHTPTVPAAL
jgi:hypothetical protein